MQPPDPKYPFYLNGRDLASAQQHWWEMFGYSHRSFWKFIGLKDTDKIGAYGTELAHRKIQMLASPHFYTLTKAFIARTGYQKKLLK